MILVTCVLLLTNAICCLSSAIGSGVDTGSAILPQESCSHEHIEVVMTEPEQDTFLDCGGHRGEWMKVATLNTIRGDKCPQGWGTECTKERHYCTGGYEAGCHSAKFPTNQTSYSRICGKIRGYQRGSMNAFFSTGYSLGTTTGYVPEIASASINGPYVDGISITVGEPRKHVWTYAVGLSDDYMYNYTEEGYNCPCAQYPGPDPPSFVGHHYYCESGNTGPYNIGRYYTDDELWDGRGCGVNNNCCAQAGSPWFFRQFSVPITGDIEVRICRDQNNSGEEVLVELMDIYIQ